MAGTSLLIKLSLVVHALCLLSPCVWSYFCTNHTECTSKNSSRPFCCGVILRFCAEDCGGFICENDEHCADNECCQNATSYCTDDISNCRDLCLTKNDCPPGEYCCKRRGENYDWFNQCAQSCKGKECTTSEDCGDAECCKDGTCHEMEDCEGDLSLATIIIIVLALCLSLIGIIVGVLACYGCFKRERHPGAIVDTQQPQQEQTLSSQYIKLDDMAVHGSSNQ